MRKILLTSVIAASLSASWAVTPEVQLDSVEAHLDTLSGNMESTMIGKNDSPVAVSGTMDFRVKNFHYSEASPWVQNDKARTSVDAFFKASLVITPNAYVTVFSNLWFPFDLSGFYTNYLADEPTDSPMNNEERVLFNHNTDYVGASIDEELNVGADIRAGFFGIYATAGGVIWASSSPLTMWERETAPRFAWQYETFEEEKTVSTYYKEKAFKPVKEGGRAFWTNRSFGGMFLNAYQLPYNMSAQFLLSQPKDMDVGTRDGLRLYGGQPGEAEMTGDYDMEGDVISGRIAKAKILDGMTVGANYMGVFFDKDIIYDNEFTNPSSNVWPTDPFLDNTHIASLDIKGNLTPKFYLMADVGLSWSDSTKFIPDSTGAYSADNTENKTSSPALGVYVKIQDKHFLPATVEAVYFGEDFFSPYGMTDPSRFRSWRKDEMYLNAGSLRYGPNMAGINIKLEPEFNRGRIGFQYGQHRQIKAGQDVLLFNYRLNGRNMWESTNSWTKFNALFWADSGSFNSNGYKSRAGVLTSERKLYRQRGGLYGGTWELWESFVAYDSQDELKNNTVPAHTKWSSFMAFEGGYDIGHWLHTDRNVMMQVYTSLSGISKTIAPIAYSGDQKDMLLWSWYAQFEPAVAVTPNFHMVGCLGFETWQSKYAYTVTSAAMGLSQGSDYNSILGTHYTYEHSPIDYLQTAIGLGFDWDFADRAGLHFRYKWATHSDKNLSENDWHSHFISAETKVWF